METNLASLIDRYPEDFGWLRRNAGWRDEDWDLSTSFRLLAERNGSYVYHGADDTVIEIHGGSEPVVNACDSDYAALVLERVKREGI